MCARVCGLRDDTNGLRDRSKLRANGAFACARVCGLQDVVNGLGQEQAQGKWYICMHVWTAGRHQWLERQEQAPQPTCTTPFWRG